MVLPTAYLPPLSYLQALMSEPVTIEQMETFEKQTFRNRCLIRDAKGELVRLTVPVGKVEHKQLTRDIQISYQTRWQHQHWITLVSAYQHTPYRSVTRHAGNISTGSHWSARINTPRISSISQTICGRSMRRNTSGYWT